VNQIVVGQGNTASGSYSTVAGGKNSLSRSNSSLVAGENCVAANGVYWIGSINQTTNAITIPPPANGSNFSVGDVVQIRYTIFSSPNVETRTLSSVSINGFSVTITLDSDLVLNSGLGGSLIPWENVFLVNLTKADSSNGQVVFGRHNFAKKEYGVIGGGFNNKSFGTNSIIGGGSDNINYGDLSAIGSGNGNTISGSYSVVSGGQSHNIDAEHSVISGGRNNEIAGLVSSTIGGGSYNSILGDYATISGGSLNTAGAVGPFNDGYHSAIGGGQGNATIGNHSTVGGGQNNTSGSVYGWATVAGGWANTASGYCSAISGGKSNTASAYYCAVGGGNANNSSGYASNVGGGQGNTASGYCSAISGGQLNTASASHGTAGGLRGVSDRYGMQAYAAGRFASDGDAQSVSFVLRNGTTNSTPTTLFLNGSAGTERLAIPSGKALFATVSVAGIINGGSKAVHYIRKVAIKNVGGTTSLIGAISTVGSDIEDDAAYDLQIVADDTNDSLQINVTGKTGETIRWVARVDGIEIAYG
jgi:hypothetical protein